MLPATSIERVPGIQDPACGAGKHWTPSQIRTRTMDWLHQYKEKYIDTGSAKPLSDTMIAMFFFSYAVAWPQVSLRGGHSCTAVQV